MVDQMAENSSCGIAYEAQEASSRQRADELSRDIIGAAIEVHRRLGQGFWNLLMKSAYAVSLG